jgi:hypothetical protein
MSQAREARAALAERAAGLERRAMEAYRVLAARFGGGEAGQRFAEMAEGEAHHFAILNLAGDFVRMGPAESEAAPDAAPDAAADLAAADPLLVALETAGSGSAGADPAAALPAAVEAAVRFESEELPRVAALVGALPEPARTRVRAGLGRTLPAHYTSLETLGRLAGRDDLAAEARRLAAEAARL